MRMLFLPAALLLATTSPALAQQRDYCPARPGLGDQPCTIDSGHVSVEIGVAQWQRGSQAGERDEDWNFAQTLVRVGVSHGTDLDIGWTPFASEGQRDAATGRVSHVSGAGDITLMARHNVLHPGGGGLSVALAPFVTLPVGSAPAGQGDWSAGMIAPINYDLGGLSVAATLVATAAPDQADKRHHFEGSVTLGASLPVVEAMNCTFELQLLRDADPVAPSTQQLAALSLAWNASKRLQLDAGGAAGLDRAAPDVELYFGVSRLF